MIYTNWYSRLFFVNKPVSCTGTHTGTMVQLCSSYFVRYTKGGYDVLVGDNRQGGLIFRRLR